MQPACDRSSGPRVELLRHAVLIAPAGWSQVERFFGAVIDPVGHAALLEGVQRFRGRSYLADGAIRERDLTPDGRHVQAMDRESWHLVVRNGSGAFVSCARYHSAAEPRFEATVAAGSALAQSPYWRPRVAQVVENSIREAKERGALFAELGGWCVADVSRNTREALQSVLYMFALGEILGGTIGLSTATTRHSSSSILQRLGAQRAALHGEELPAYFDSRFDCQMELLQFDSLRPAPRYAGQVAAFRRMLQAEMRVVCAAPPQPTCTDSLTALLVAVRLESSPGVLTKTGRP